MVLTERFIKPDFRRKGWESASPKSSKILVLRSHHFQKRRPPTNILRFDNVALCSYIYGLFNSADSFLNGLSSLS